MLYLIRLGVMVGLLLGCLGSAEATPITKTVDFTASGFIPDFPFPSLIDPPVNPVTGSFTLTFDPSVLTLGDTTHITTNSLNINVPGVVFDYFPLFDTLVIGGLPLGAVGIVPYSDDFMLVLAGFVHGSGWNEFLYSQRGKTVFLATSVETSPVPLPQTWFLLVSGLGVLALLAWRGRKRTENA